MTSQVLDEMGLDDLQRCVQVISRTVKQITSTSIAGSSDVATVSADNAMREIQLIVAMLLRMAEENKQKLASLRSEAAATQTLGVKNSSKTKTRKASWPLSKNYAKTKGSTGDGYLRNMWDRVKDDAPTYQNYGDGHPQIETVSPLGESARVVIGGGLGSQGTSQGNLVEWRLCFWRSALLPPRREVELPPKQGPSRRILLAAQRWIIMDLHTIKLNTKEPDLDYHELGYISHMY